MKKDPIFLIKVSLTNLDQFPSINIGKKFFPSLTGAHTAKSVELIILFQFGVAKFDKTKLKTVETSEKIVLPTAEDIKQAKEEETAE